MARKKKNEQEKQPDLNPNAHILGAGEVVNQRITETLEINYMPYAMSVIMSRAIPEIDGFKPAHRKLLYTMYKMGLLNGARVKSANIVGRTMQLNPHGDAAIYDTMVRLSRGYEALLHPFVDSKGNFGKAYSRDMMWAASRYTEAKLESICAELFGDIDKDTVDFVDNYDASMKEPVLLPVSFPSVLVNANTGIAVGMASSICSFNLTEVCECAAALIKDPDYDVSEIIKAPDFIGGGRIIYDAEEMRNVIDSGRGSIRVRAKYSYDKSNNCIDITEIPPTTTAEAIIEKMVEKYKAGALKEISDVRDETDKLGLKITIDLKRGTDPDKLMLKLYRTTSLEDTFSCNFNVLIAGMPRVLGIKELLIEWIAFRTECVRRRVYFDLEKARNKLHLLEGLQKILLDIDKAIRIIRNTDEEKEVVTNLMIGFGIDEVQAEYVAEIRLRHLNREYILKHTRDIEDLKSSIEDMTDILNRPNRVKKLIIDELKAVEAKYGKPRRSEIIYRNEIDETDDEPSVSAEPVYIVLSKGGYFKKITPQSLRMSGEQKFKEGDSLDFALDTTNDLDVLFFTNKQQAYKAKINDFDFTKASALGEYVPSKLDMDTDEIVTGAVITKDYSGYILFFFENGKAAKVTLASYATKTNRKKLIKAFSDKSPLVALKHITEDGELVLVSSAGRYLLLNTGAVSVKSTKDTQGVAVMTLKKGQRLMTVRDHVAGEFAKPYRYRTKNLPSAGAMLSSEDSGEQLKL